MGKKSGGNGETTAALQAMLMQVQMRASQAEAEAGQHETYASVAQRQVGENQGLRDKNLARRNSEQDNWTGWDTKAKDFLTRRDETSRQRDEAQGQADRQRDANSALEAERNARIAELRRKVQGGLTPDKAADTAAEPSPQQGGTYVPPVTIDPVVAVDPQLNAEQKARASALVDAAKAAGVAA